MSQLLIPDLTLLSSESRRKHPEIKQSCDVITNALKSSPDATLSSCRTYAGTASDHPLLKPVLLACDTKLPKVISLAMTLLQRILLQKLIPDHNIPTVISSLQKLLNPPGRIDPDVQLKVLQIASALLSTYPSIHDQHISQTLFLGFTLQEGSKVAVVSSTAAATLRSSVMTIFEKVKDEDQLLDSISTKGGEEAAATAPLAALSVNIPTSSPHHPSEESVTLFPCSKDAYLLFEDLCDLANGDPAQFLQLPYLSKTFSLELIESVLSNHAKLFASKRALPGSSRPASHQHPELLFLLRSKTCPLLIKALSEQPSFPVYLRLMRLLFLLLRQFSSDLVLEVEILITILLRSIHPTAQDLKAHGGSAPLLWQQVLALEVIRSLCSDDLFLRNLWQWYDAASTTHAPIENAGSGSIKIFSKLVQSLSAVAIEGEKLFAPEPSMRQASTSHLSSPPQSPRKSRARESLGDRSYSGLYEAAAGVASGAAAAVSGVFSSSDSTGTESLASSSSPTVQIIDQLDKADPPSASSPSLPKSYPQLLALQSFLFLTQSMALYALPIYSKFVNSRGVDSAPAPPSLNDADIEALKSKSEKQGISTTKAMLADSALAISHVLTRYLKIKSTDPIFEETLLALRNLTNVTGALGLDKQRDTILLQFIPLAVPGWDPSSPLPTGAIDQGVSVSSRNLASLKAFTQVVYYLSGSLAAFWHPVLSGLCSAQTLLTTLDPSVARKRLNNVDEEANPEASAGPSSQSQVGTAYATLSTLTHTSSSILSMDSRSGKSQLQLLNPVDLQPAQLEAQIQRIFQNTSSLDETAFFDFVSALCRLSAEMLRASVSEPALPQQEDQVDPKSRRSSSQTAASRRQSLLGGNKPEDIPFFPLSSIGLVSKLNIGRLCRLPAAEGWELITNHLVATLSDASLPSAWRLQASQVTTMLLFASMGEDASFADRRDDRLRLQQRIFQVFAKISIMDDRKQSSTDLEIRRVSLGSLHKVLETFGHSFLCGWEVIFQICCSSCKTSPQSTDRGQGGKASASTKYQSALIKSAFSCLQLVCSDFLSSLSLDQIKLCIECLKEFSVQGEDVNVALTANGCLWGVTAEMASRDLAQLPPQQNASSQVGVEREDIARFAVPGEQEAQGLWLYLLECLLSIAQDPRSDVRNGAISQLYRVLQQYGESLSVDVWGEICQAILFPLLKALQATTLNLLDNLPSSSEQELKDQKSTMMGTLPSELKQWQESQTLAYLGLGQVVKDYLVSKLIEHSRFEESIWNLLLDQCKKGFLEGGNDAIADAAIRCFALALSPEFDLKDSGDRNAEAKIKLRAAWEQAWLTWVAIGQSISGDSFSTSSVDTQKEEDKAVRVSPRRTTNFTQKNLVSYIQVFSRIYRVIKPSFDARRMEILLTCLKKCMSYATSPDNTRDDGESLTPLQESIQTLIRDLSKEVVGIQSMVLSDMSDCILLAFEQSANAASDAKSTQSRTLTYIALCRKSIDEGMKLYLDSQSVVEDELELYRSGSFQSYLEALGTAIKLKYECPSSTSTAGSCVPLWKAATVAFCRIILACCPTLEEKIGTLGEERIASIWKLIFDNIESSILADCSPVLNFTKKEREDDEKFSLYLLNTIQVGVMPYAGGKAVPDELLDRFGWTLAQGSVLYSRIKGGLPEDDELDHALNASGRTDDIYPQPNERFAYWCFDLLFFGCHADHSHLDQRLGGRDPEILDQNRRRLSRFLLPHLIQRSEQVFGSYCQDKQILGMVPMDRLREEEISYVLTRYLDLEVYPQAADPNRSAEDVKPAGGSRVVGSSSKSHLFSSYRYLLSLLKLRAPAGSTSSFITVVGSGLPSILPAKRSEWEEEFHGQSLGIVGTVGWSNNILKTADSSVADGETGESRERKLTVQDLAERALSMVGDVLGVPG